MSNQDSSFRGIQSSYLEQLEEQEKTDSRREDRGAWLMAEKNDSRVKVSSAVGASPSVLEKLRGKRTKDIHLPNLSGIVDPRLKKRRSSKFAEALEFFQKAGKK
jgi:hypothetical protein